jgi:hypothetical protein
MPTTRNQPAPANSSTRGSIALLVRVVSTRPGDAIMWSSASISEIRIRPPGIGAGDAAAGGVVRGEPGEALADAAAVHWSIPDPVPAGDAGSFDAALAQLADRVGRLAPRLAAVS